MPNNYTNFTTSLCIRLGRFGLSNTIVVNYQAINKSLLLSCFKNYNMYYQIKNDKIPIPFWQNFI